jgi:hypothetical protein
MVIFMSKARLSITKQDSSRAPKTSSNSQDPNSSPAIPAKV